MSYTSYKDVDMSQFINSKITYTFEEICEKLNIDTRDDIVQYLLNTDVTASIEMNEKHLKLMGITRKQFLALLHNNSALDYNIDTNRINMWDFEFLCMQLDNDTGIRFRRKCKQIKYAFDKYWEYKELLYKEQRKNYVENSM